MSIQRYYLGCPIWGNKAWVGEFFKQEANHSDYLTQYATVFNTVEGNTTFYGMPIEATVAKWQRETPEMFRFCFKFPQTITHEKRLRHVSSETTLFLQRLEPLGKRLGPFLLQLPASFGPTDIPILADYLNQLPTHFQYAVEVRHLEFFDFGESEAMLNDLLSSFGVDRAHMITDALRSAQPNDQQTQAAQEQKPNLPRRTTVTATRPFIRYVGHPIVEQNKKWLAQWVTVLVGWLQSGYTPAFFVHSPDNFYAPHIARLFHDMLSKQLNVGTMPAWPIAQKKSEIKQLSLF